MPLRLAWLPVLAVLGASPLRADEGVLQQVREQVSGPAKPEPACKTDKRDDSDDCNDALGELFGPLAGEALLAPFCLPKEALGDDYKMACAFPRFPYAYGRPGYIWMDRDAGEGEATDPAPRGWREWSVRMAAEDGFDFRGVNRVGARLFLDTASRFGVATDWDFFQERRPCGCYDTLTLGDVNLTFRFAQCEWMQMYAGLGGRLMPDRSDTRGGFNFTYGTDVFPRKPVVVSSSLDLGNLGSVALVRARGTVGLVHRRWELFGGYDFLRIGSVNLQGPMAGLRLWF